MHIYKHSFSFEIVFQYSYNHKTCYTGYKDHLVKPLLNAGIHYYGIPLFMFLPLRNFL